MLNKVGLSIFNLTELIENKLNIKYVLLIIFGLSILIFPETMGKIIGTWINQFFGTIYKNIKRLDAGNILIFDESGIRLKEYFSLIDLEKIKN